MRHASISMFRGPMGQRIDFKPNLELLRWRSIRLFREEAVTDEANGVYRN